MIAAGLFFKAIGTGIWNVVSKIPLKAWAALAVVVAIWLYGVHKERVGVAKQAIETAAVQSQLDAERAEAKAYRDEIKKAIAARLKANALKERADAAAFALAAKNLRDQNEKSKRDADRIIADLRNGNLRLRKRFTCPTNSADGRPETSTGAGGNNEASEGGFSIEDQGFFIRIGSEADAVANQLTACQNILNAEREIK